MRRQKILSLLTIGILTACLGISAFAAGGRTLSVPSRQSVESVAVFGDFVKHEVTGREDIERVFALLQGIDDLRAPNEKYAFAAGGVERGVLLALSGGKTVCYDVWSDRVQRTDSDSPYILSEKTGALSTLIDELSGKYPPTIEPFSLGFPEKRTDPGQAGGENMHLYDNATKSYAALSGGRREGLITALAALEGDARAAKKEELGAPLGSPDSLAVYDGEIKLEYEFYENGLLLKTQVNRYRFGQEPLREDWGIADRAFVISGERYRALRNTLRADWKALKKGSYWLGMMRAYKLGDAGEGAFRLHNFLTGYERVSGANAGIIFYDLKALRVEPESYQKIAGQKTLEEPELSIEIRFEGGVVYTVSMNRESLQVYSNDVNYAIRHRFASDSPGYERLLEVASPQERYADVRQNPGT